eukprot:1720412-Prymnesium_polylepis.1
MAHARTRAARAVYTSMVVHQHTAKRAWRVCHARYRPLPSTPVHSVFHSIKTPSTPFHPLPLPSTPVHSRPLPSTPVHSVLHCRARACDIWETCLKARLRRSSLGAINGRVLLRRRGGEGVGGEGVGGEAWEVMRKRGEAWEVRAWEVRAWEMKVRGGGEGRGEGVWSEGAEVRVE